MYTYLKRNRGPSSPTEGLQVAAGVRGFNVLVRTPDLMRATPKLRAAGRVGRVERAGVQQQWHPL